jgi:peptide/nickel transport system permease protein
MIITPERLPAPRLRLWTPQFHLRGNWGTAVLVAITVLALCGPWFIPHSHVVDPSGIPFTKPGHGGYLLGTDEVGRSIAARLVYGMRTSWFSALALVASGVIIGSLVGLVAGTAGGIVDAVLMRICDLFLALPATLLAIAIVSAIGPSLMHTLVALGIVWWAYYARIVRSEVRSLAARPHLEAARLSGISRARVGLRHLLPGTLPVIIVAASLDVGACVVTFASLSFIGLGPAPPAPELGSMAAQGITYLLTAWWIPVLPGVAVFVLAFLANLCGDSIRSGFADR